MIRLEKEKPNLVVATPDRFRILSKLPSDHLVWNNFVTVVLDEADKLLKPLGRYPTKPEIRNYNAYPKPAKLLVESILKV